MLETLCWLIKEVLKGWPPKDVFEIGFIYGHPYIWDLSAPKDQIYLLNTDSVFYGRA